MTEEKIRENRLRRMAERQGLEIKKSRRRDPRALDFGHWHIVNRSTGERVAEALSIDEIKNYLTGGGEA